MRTNITTVRTSTTRTQERRHAQNVGSTYARVYVCVECVLTTVCLCFTYAVGVLSTVTLCLYVLKSGLRCVGVLVTL